MTTNAVWAPFEGSIKEIAQAYSEPLLALARGEVPALVLRGAYDPQHCAALVDRFYERGLLYDPHASTEERPHRVDIGTSFGKWRQDREAFFAHSNQTLELFSTLFDGYRDPVQTMYENLAQLAPSKEVKTAREPDGRLYGPAIFRTYYAEIGHTPHFDSVAKRTKAIEYQISRFKHQFAGILCFQNSDSDGRTGEPFIYNCPWTPDMQPYLNPDAFRGYVEEQGVARVQVHLEPGDLYFFFTENIHEVPHISGDQPRIVLAIFFAMSPDDDEIFVWA